MVEQVAAEAWSFRWRVELDAAARFAQLGTRFQTAGAPSGLVALAARSAGDERRHAEHCARLAREYGATLTSSPPVHVEEIAPAQLSFADRVLYEAVAACCVTETVSVAVLCELLSQNEASPLKSVLRELAEDEVAHSRMGWMYLAHARSKQNVAFLETWIPSMLAVTESEALFGAAPEGREDPALVLHGVLPWSVKRRLFEEALEEVIFPGLETNGISSGPSRQWLEAQRARR